MLDEVTEYLTSPEYKEDLAIFTQSWNAFKADYLSNLIQNLDNLSEAEQYSRLLKFDLLGST